MLQRRYIVTVDALKRAKEKGAKTICLTSTPDSLITKYFDCKLEIYSDEIQYPIEAISARIAHFSVVDAITIALSSKDYENSASRAKATHELLEGIRY